MLVVGAGVMLVLPVIVVELIMLAVSPTCDSGGGCAGVIFMLVVGPTCDSGEVLLC